MLLRNKNSLINVPTIFSEMALINDEIKFNLPTEKESLEFCVKYDDLESATKAFEEFYNNNK